MANTPRWRGSKDIKLQPGFPKFFSRGDVEGYRLCYRGPFLTLKSQRPARGSQLQGYAGYYVEEVTIEPDGAGTAGPGTMLVTIASAVPGGTTSPADETVIEIDAGSLEKSIYAHPEFKDIEKADIAKLKKALENKEPVPGPTLPGPLEGPLQKLADLLQRGTESYLVAAPIVRKTTTSHARPTIGAIGKGTRTTTKPHPAAPDGYQWLKTADKATQTGAKGKWERIEQWTGADVWDETLYS